MRWIGKIDPNKIGDLLLRGELLFEAKSPPGERSPMVILPQQRLFRWEQIEELGDLERLRLALENLPDDDLIGMLERERGKGRNDYPVRVLWNCLIAVIVFQHPSIASLRREFLRNAQLRWECGLNGKVPEAWVFSRFLKKLRDLRGNIGTMSENLSEELGNLLPDFGERLAIDGKAIRSHGKPSKAEAADDGRREKDANWGTKTYWVRKRDGTVEKKKESWFGFKLHLVVDAHYELPVAFMVERASEPEAPKAHELLERMEQRQPWLLDRCDVFMADRGYDDGKLIKKLWDKHEIRPVIDIRNAWKDGEPTRLLPGTDNVVYDYRGNVYCHCPKTGARRSMAYGGFEKERGTLKYRCPAQQYGVGCKSNGNCAACSGVRVKLETDRRIFVPVARSSYKWAREYKKRTSVERVNSRLDVSFGFENHFIRGLAKMEVFLGLGICVMQALALGRLKRGEKDLMRSLVAS